MDAIRSCPATTRRNSLPAGARGVATILKNHSEPIDSSHACRSRPSATWRSPSSSWHFPYRTEVVMSFNHYYQSELTALRELGKRFAERNPALAPFLGQSGRDPDVE